MKILFTGASSFTGMWFVHELALAGHDITATFQKKSDAYSGLRKKRIQQIDQLCHPIYDCPFGSESFLNVVRSADSWDILCHHAADVTDYKNPDFDFATALANNTRNLKQVLITLKEKGCNRLLLTGSVFEQNEGAGSDGLRAVSPYGLSKGLTSDVYRCFTEMFQIKLDKFVIPNPFGPWEEPRFTQYLLKNWFAEKTALVSTPDYIRDNIHVSLLANAYAAFTNKPRTTDQYEKFSPSGYRESQGTFAERFAHEMRVRTGLPCHLELKEQKEFPEPRERVNTESLDIKKFSWNEKKAWDEIAHYYMEIKNEL